MEWDSRLDEIFKDMDQLLEPQMRNDPYPVLKKMRDLMKKAATILTSARVSDERTGCF